MVGRLELEIAFDSQPELHLLIDPFIVSIEFQKRLVSDAVATDAFPLPINNGHDSKESSPALSYVLDAEIELA